MHELELPELEHLSSPPQIPRISYHLAPSMAINSALQEGHGSQQNLSPQNSKTKI